MSDRRDRAAVRIADQKVDVPNDHHDLAADLSDDRKAVVKCDYRDHGTKAVWADPRDHVVVLNVDRSVDVFHDHRDHAAGLNVALKVCSIRALHAGHGDHH